MIKLNHIKSKIICAAQINKISCVITHNIDIRLTSPSPVLFLTTQHEQALRDYHDARLHMYYGASPYEDDVSQG